MNNEEKYLKIMERQRLAYESQLAVNEYYLSIIEVFKITMINIKEKFELENAELFLLTQLENILDSLIHMTKVNQASARAATNEINETLKKAGGLYGL